jgi:hypothetical protein
MRKQRTFYGAFLAVLAFTILHPRPGEAKATQKPPCAPDIGACSDEGCGSDFDPNLNKQKNIREKDPRAGGAVEAHSLAWMKRLEDPENFEKGGSREELESLGEGKKIRVVAYLIAAKPELGGESCNCGLHTAAETDNHLVLVTKATVDKFSLDPDDADDATIKDTFHSRELESGTAEFTPRIRKFDHHPNFTRQKLQPMIDEADQKALLVRVTGILLFDSEHFLRNHLVRVNNWEIHPVLELEVCTAKTCSARSEEGWKSLDDL